MKPILVEREVEEQTQEVDGAVRRRRVPVRVNVAESPLSWLHARGHLDDRLFAAGEMLRRDYERASLGPQITMRWDPVRIERGARTPGTPGERAIAAKQRFDEALRAAGPGLQDILWRVVCAGESLAMAEAGLEWPSRSGKLVLRIALERVAQFYRVQ
ncbi:hypothetical protein EYB45_05575 [Erythrobacteraceae bacterium CFH 75059]|uniref:DUF6456 domain-containing protein n=1 Tax=Qipengyuania thermophila TaxID=2509361 RepID=UPI001020C013|nr:DUF6456 domain-containing protein [Qipengyuania thermophila]TCD04994.1 hypothetical protein EYB45_05575 [Erythrobacteraceae bacterium CFH 75059]